MYTAFFHGFAVALGLILPLGVQNVFIFTQGASQPQYSRTLPAVIAASLSDTALILMAVYGVSAIVLNFAWLKLTLVTLGAIFITYMGWLTWRSPVNLAITEETNAWPLKRQVVFALSVSLLNPHAILDTIGVIGTTSLAYQGPYRLAFTMACILVSWLWFAFLAAMGRQVREIDRSGDILKLLNKLSALIMWVSGLYLIYLNL